MSSKEGQTVIEFRDVVRTYGEGKPYSMRSTILILRLIRVNLW